MPYRCERYNGLNFVDSRLRGNDRLHLISTCRDQSRIRAAIELQVLAGGESGLCAAQAGAGIAPVDGFLAFFARGRGCARPIQTGGRSRNQCRLAVNSEIHEGRSIRPQSLKVLPARRNPLLEPAANRAQHDAGSVSLSSPRDEGA
jgi:hypothetical protein